MTISTLGCGQPVLSSSTFTPASLTGLIGWYDAQNSGSITQSSGLVSQWNDLSTIANNVSQATSANQPTYGATSFNSKPGIRFFATGSSNFLQSSALPVASINDCTVFVVFNIATIAGYSTLYALGGSGDEFDIAVRQTTPNFAILYSSNTTPNEADSSISLSTATNYYGCWQRSSGTTSFRINGSADATTTAQANNITIAVSSTLIGGDNAGEPFDGTIAEVIVYNRALTVTEIGQVETYIKSRWGL